MPTRTAAAAGKSRRTAVADTIRANIRARDLTQQRIADALGISQGQVSARMRGEIEWRLGELDTVAVLLGISISDLLKDLAS